MRNGLIKTAKAALCVAACFGAAQAAPTSPKVVAGQASFSQQGNVFSITNTPGTIINWQSFSVGAGEVTRFIQQSSDSAVLNRVNGQDPSRILGALQSNGKVFLINPNGVVFGQGARVDVGGLVASTLHLSDADFLAGKKHFTSGPEQAGAVRNEGAITTPSGGKVFLVAPNVENSGVITAPNGEVVLAAGRSVQLVDASNPDLHVVVSAPGDGAVNLGQVVAQGGRIGIYGALVNQRGVVNANSAVVGQDGKIVLKARGDTVLGAGSLTSATGAGKGGSVALLGERVGLAGDAVVDASGALGGGTVLVGGDYQGKNAALPNAQQTWFGKDARIRADALVAGNGGKVVLWSDGATTAQGSISARGNGGGNGGLVETSGHDLDTAGIRVDTGAPGGATGTWLLDPWNIIVRSSGTAPASSVDVFSKGPGNENTVVSARMLTDTNANIVLQARNDLTIEENISTTNGVRAEAGNDLLIAATVQAGRDIDLRAGNRLTLAAGSVLKSADYIDLKAERMTLAGSIGGVNGVAPIVSFSSFNRGTSITVSGAANAEAAGVLALDPARLGAFDVFGINIGDSGHTGAIQVDQALTMAGNLSIDTGGVINIKAPVRLTGATSQFYGSLHPYLGGGVIQVDEGGRIEAVDKVELSGGSIRVKGAIGAKAITILAGSDGIQLDGGLDAGGRMSLRSTGAVNQAAGSVVKAQQLRVDGTLVNMAGANQVGTLAGAASSFNFRFNWLGALNIGSVDELTGVKAGVEVGLNGGALVATAGIEGAAVMIDAASISGSGIVKANMLQLTSRGGIGAATAPLNTSAQVLNATNTASGSAPINIVNDRALVVQDVVQAGAGNLGAISIDTTGGLTVAATEGSRQGVKTGSGDISLVTHSPMTILGKVSTDSGNIRLLADNGGALTISGGGQVASGSGSVSVTAGTTTIPAGSILVSSPDKLSVTSANAPPPPPPPPDPIPDPIPEPIPDPIPEPIPEPIPDPIPEPIPEPVPPLDTCLATPNAAGCAPVVQAALQACIANPDGPQCGRVLPQVQACRASPDSMGCAVVLQRAALLECIANPGGANCGAILPAYAVCAASPSTLGCVPVLARAEFDACLVNPAGPGCAAVLPPLGVCKATPGAEGCDKVLQLSFNACLAKPNDASCSGILPTLSQCVVNKAAPGCEVVLPTLAQCIGSPTLQGCSVQLPRLEQCAVNPNLAGCEAVLPKPSFCATHPLDPSCQVFTPSDGKTGQDTPVTQTQKTTVVLINASTQAAPGNQQASGATEGGEGKPADKAEQQAGPAPGTNPGANNEKPATKMYCN